MKSTIRPATQDDVHGLIDLFFGLFAYQHQGNPSSFRGLDATADDERNRTREYVLSVLADTNATILVAQTDQGRVAGFIHAIFQDTPRSPSVPFREQVKQVWIQHLYVAEAFRGFGLGRQLEERAEDWGRERGAERVGLQVWAFAEEAIQLYDSLGYKKESLRLSRSLT
jgi:GNAT superfamily N-acetyltransferase